MIYLDNSATTKMDEEVLEAMMPWMTADFGNASSIHQLGRRARVAIEDARTEIAQYLNAHPAELIFTSGGTESNNTIIKSALFESGLCGALASPLTEHHSVLNPIEEIAKNGTAWHTLKVDERGVVAMEDSPQIASAETLFCVMHANNETGVIQPLARLRARYPDAFIHTDAVQSFGKIPVDVKELGVDFATISAHKIHGPKGIGAMFIRKGIDFKAHQQGGGQERNRRAGTEAPHLIVGFAVAARRAIKDLEVNFAKFVTLRTELHSLLVQHLESIRINTDFQNSIPNIVNLSFLDAEGLDGEAILQSMDIAGVAVSNGSACVSGSSQPSHVLSALGLPKSEASAALRFSLSKYTTIDEIREAVTILSRIIRNMRVITHN